MDPKPPSPARPKIPQYVRTYIETALWSSHDESDDRGGEPLDANYGVVDVADESVLKCIADCDAFIERAGSMLAERGIERGMHDFWLTRNGHGAGFWDGDWPENGDALTALAESFGPLDPVVGDDGMIYFD